MARRTQDIKILTLEIINTPYNTGNIYLSHHKVPPKTLSKKTANNVMKKYDGLCAKCGGVAEEIHHIDRNKYNNDFFNLLPLCRKCHREITPKGGRKGVHIERVSG